jgi:hypothetical protein
LRGARHAARGAALFQPAGSGQHVEVGAGGAPHQRRQRGIAKAVPPALFDGGVLLRREARIARLAPLLSQFIRRTLEVAADAGAAGQAQGRKEYQCFHRALTCLMS